MSIHSSFRFVEYFDLRHCEQSLKESNGVEFGGPGSNLEVRMAYNSKYDINLSGL